MTKISHVFLVALPHTSAVQLATDQSLNNNLEALIQKFPDIGTVVSRMPWLFDAASNWLSSQGKSLIGQFAEATRPAKPIPLEHLDHPQDYTGTLAEEMDYFKKGSLVLLQRVQDDVLLQAARDEWALDFTGGSKYCSKLLSEEDCAKPLKDSLVLVVGEELHRWGDDAHYFKMRDDLELVVHGRLHQHSPAFVPSSSPAAGNPSLANNYDFSYYLPTSIYREDRLQIIVELQAAPAEQMNSNKEILQFPRGMAARFFERLGWLLKDGFLASDWTPCAPHWGTTSRFLPTVHFVPIDSSTDIQKARALQKMRQAIEKAFGQQQDLKKLLDTFAEKELGVSVPDAQTLLEDLKTRTRDWKTKPDN